MIRSSKHTLKFSNKDKLLQLNNLYNDYLVDLKYYINLIKNNKLPLKTNLSSKDLPTNLIKHSQYKQVIYKNASEIVRSNIQKIKNKCYSKYKKLYSKCLNKKKHFKFTNKLYKELNINYLKRIKIDVKNISLNIDNRLFDIELSNKSFNEFINLRLPYFYETKKRAISLKLPIKYHKHSLKFKDWNRLNTIKLLKENNKFYVVYCYEKENTVKRSNGSQIGLDQGYKKLISDSNGNHYGVNLNSIYDKLSKKKRGSKNYNDLLTHKNNLINQTVNKISFSDIKDVYIEDLCNVKYKSKLSTKLMNKLQYWSFRNVIDKLDNLSEIEGFNIIKVEPAYTSQRCSNCGLIDKSNRIGEIYKCSCGIEIDADTNAAINILLRGVYNPSTTKKQLSI